MQYYARMQKKWALNVVNQLAKRWELENLIPLARLSHHYVFRAMQNDKAVILKLGFDQAVLAQEAAALQAFDNYGCVRLLNRDVELGALLLEQAVPGISLRTYVPTQDTAAVKIVSQVMQRLHQTNYVNSGTFPTVAHWLAILDKDFDLPEYHLKKARALSKQLLATSAESVLLHGDLHHDNILFHRLDKSTDQWYVIDPKGVMGEPAYEVGAFIRNPISELCNQTDITEIIKTRIQFFAEYLTLDAQRIRDWSYVQAVLAACWMLEDNLDLGVWLRIAEIIDKIN
jgi:streptomycin 6-kinase